MFKRQKEWERAIHSPAYTLGDTVWAIHDNNDVEEGIITTIAPMGFISDRSEAPFGWLYYINGRPCFSEAVFSSLDELRSYYDMPKVANIR